MLCRTLLRILRCTRSRLVEVRPAVMSNIESRKRVRRRRRGSSAPTGSVRDDVGPGSGEGFTESADEFVSHAMHSAEVYWARWVPLQFLAEFKNVVVHGTGRRIVLVAPHIVEQFVAADDPVGILYQKLECLKFLSGQNYGFPIPHNFHFLEVDGDAVEVDDLHIRGARGVAQRGPHPCQQFSWAERLGDI